MNSFKDNIEKIFNILVSPINSIYKYEAINNFKHKLSIGKDENISLKYYEFIKGKKETGVIYTPEQISNYMIKNTVSKKDIINNPFIKILDPSCGCGNILIPCFFYLQNIFKENLEEINKNNNINLKEQYINKHILDNNLYGFDIDSISIKILIIDLFYLTGYYNNNNFKKKDFLIQDINNNFDVYIGNPPYVGHKSVDKKYSMLLKEKYGHIYKDKGDISYCFFINALNYSNINSKITFITSRYFMESKSGYNLRKYLKENCNIYKILDFYGIRPFKGAGIDPAIIFIDRSISNKVEVIKPCKYEKVEMGLFFKQEDKYENFYVHNSQLKQDGWVLIDDISKDIINKIENKANKTLKETCTSYQGIITGCDKAFIVNEDTIEKENLEKSIIKSWIKSSYINRGKIDFRDSFIIYSNLIENVDKYPNIIKHIEKYKDKLENRRECKKKVRKWYELQWGRNLNIFEEKKIIFPYKSSKNKFYLDKEGTYFSADVYALTINKEENIDYNSLLIILNSDIYEFYFKTFGKKLGGSLYEYYPSTLMKLKIPMVKINKEEDLYKYFNLNDNEIKFIQNKLLIN
ncbi:MULTISPECIES: Eco57I restriction-modification methylase domain-containing protein [Clostridium]|uniref:site-specific DNA-methyltransferase (adenine-specific) n=1 Tax=Clostridium sporogenes TaxID=1509 RepID=A0ABX4K4A5_CLOSG|nr:TaqI-like C-terminal specificity domain-containing protein [Clostridium sporogenes]STC83558.1 modification methylase [Clostridium botulinum]KOY66573.1 DNA methyltransferase [Clostridium sporogenes]MBW5457741.1 class I SAM-dependent DNA methyltransferase [Clostridium sporogenes]MDS1006076.1 TaqI-like C-terminal specificity domain-containing protein [Clostridium sporogenes]NFQ02731.1 class I SAM-dependent DNA methyltransferase [Clostridium sporogenes]